RRSLLASGPVAADLLRGDTTAEAHWRHLKADRHAAPPQGGQDLVAGQPRRGWRKGRSRAAGRFDEDSRTRRQRRPFAAQDPGAFGGVFATRDTDGGQDRVEQTVQPLGAGLAGGAMLRLGGEFL